MLKIRTSGSPVNRGRQQGQACCDKVRPWLDARMADLRIRYAVSTNDEVVRKLRPSIQTWQEWMTDIAPELNEELSGIASGLGIDEMTYLAVIFSSDLPDDLTNCTTAAFRDAKGHTVLGKTDDLYLKQLGMNILEVAEPDSGYRHAHLHFAGSIFTTAGMNERGLAMGMNGVPGKRTGCPGLSSEIAIHTILPACATVEEAIQFVRNLPVTCGGFNLVLGDKAGTMAMIEKTSMGCGVLSAGSKDYLLHTNHLLDPDLARINPCQMEPLNTNSQKRFRHATPSLESCGRSLASMHELLFCKEGDGAICQTGDADLYTDYVIIFQPMAGCFEYWQRDTGGEKPERIEIDRLWRES